MSVENSTDSGTSSTDIAKAEEEFEPDPDDLMWVRMVKYLPLADGKKRPYEVADAIDGSIDYARRQANELAEEGIIEKSYGGQIIGHPMPGGQTEVLSNSREKLLNIVDRYASDRLSEARSQSTIEELREFIEANIAIGPGHPLGSRKVFYEVT